MTSSFPGGELRHVETEGLLIECIHTVLGANNSKVSKITTSNCMRRNHDWVLITCTQRKQKKLFGCWQVFIFQCFIWEFVEAFWFCGMVLPVWAKSTSCAECSNDVKTNLAVTFTSLRCTFSVLFLCVPGALPTNSTVVLKKNSPMRNHLWLVLKLIPLFTCNHSVRVFFFRRVIEYVSQENSVMCLDLQTVNGRSCTKTKTVVSF